MPCMSRRAELVAHPLGFSAAFTCVSLLVVCDGCTVWRHEDNTLIALCDGSRCFISDVTLRLDSLLWNAHCSSSVKGELSRRLPALGSWRSSRLAFLTRCLPKCTRCKAAASSLVEAGFANLSPIIMPFVFLLIFTCRRWVRPSILS
jgi:hypothetical protein